MTKLVILFSLVDEGKRKRKDYGDLSGLKESLVRVGSIHPIVLSLQSNGTYLLVAGGRRYRAMKELGVTELTQGSVLEHGKFGFNFKEDVPEDELREAELDENLYRLKPRWQEDVEMIADVHALKRARFGTGNWGLEQTAELLGKGYGKSNVNYALRLARLIKAGDASIMACGTISEAIATMLKRKQDEALAEVNKRVAERASKAGPVIAGIALPTGTSSFLDSFVNTPTILTPSVAGAAPPPSQHIVQTSVPQEAIPPVIMPFSRMFFLGDFREVTKDWEDSVFDHCVTDIPYGIDMDNMVGVEDVAAEHDVAQNLELMRPFLETAYRLVKPGGFCVFFYDLDHHEKLQNWAREIGWKVQPWPFIACKLSACRNQSAQYNRTKNFEVAMYLRKDEKTVLRQPCPTSWKAYDFYPERKLYNNPFAKPFELWKDIYESISFPGQSTLDLCCGEMSSLRAAANLGLIPFGVELKEQHYNRGLEHMRGVYAVIHKSNVEFK